MWLPTIVAPTGEPTTAKRSADVVIAPTSRKAAMMRRRCTTGSMPRVASGTRKGSAKATVRKM